MKRDHIFEAIGNADDELLARCEASGNANVCEIAECPRTDTHADVTPARPKTGRKWAALAACACLMIGGGALGLFAMGFFDGMGAAGGSGHDPGATTFMSYAGPVFPLTAVENGAVTAADPQTPLAGITAERNVTLDFEPWIEQWISEETHPDGGYYHRSSDIIVRDDYTLTNTTEEEKQLTLYYPYVSSLWYLDELTPELSVNGEPVAAKLHIGDYSGGFAPAAGIFTTDEEFQAMVDEAEKAGETLELMNLLQLNSWEDYKALLSSGRYQQQAVTKRNHPQLSDTVTVYRFTDEYGPEETDDMPNPTVRAMFHMDYDKTRLLTSGFHAGLYDSENQIRGAGFSIRRPDERPRDYPLLLIACGEDIGQIELDYYVTGGWDTKEHPPAGSCGVTVIREEMTLDEILRETAKSAWDLFNSPDSIEIPLNFEDYYQLYCDYVFAYYLGDTAIARYDSGSLEELDLNSVSRVCYLSTDVTIPAGETIGVGLTMSKEASFDYHCAHTENQGISGYDLAARLGSALTFRDATATLEDHGQIVITNQNFGFDLESGVKTVPITEEEHYYLEVKRAADTESQQ